MNFTNIIIHIQIGMANGINMDLSLSKNYEIRSDLPRLTVCKILAYGIYEFLISSLPFHEIICRIIIQAC